MVELTLDTAQKAVDAYVIVKDKYKDAELENFESLQDFVDRDPVGKAFEADIKLAGFANVTDSESGHHHGRRCLFKYR